jgi:DEAD/DEAH box helicase domain-containing protein
MLPAHIAENIRKQVLFYLQSTFAFRDRLAEKAFIRFLEDPDTGIFKGPWIQLRRPFRPAPAGCTFPLDITIPFHPFLHQYLSWKRLSSKTKGPQSTIVTTGTGSGKTECFLYPILDHCLRAKRKGQKGIKAIVLYPMNALAADQEKRFAEVVLTDPLLKEAGIRVGNYTGRYDPSDPGAAENSGYREMGRVGETWHGISNHAAQQETPPDILLTNYKMLDFLLMRPQDQSLWRFNEHDVLQYLVLDELHTYDGAQGADVACLIRRLKERLAIPQGRLCVVGTSATLDEQVGSGRESDGSGDTAGIDTIETGADRLARFAGTLFEEAITAECVIGENRLTVEEIVSLHLEDIHLPTPALCHPLDGEDALAYAKRLAIAWGAPAAMNSSDPLEQEELDDTWLLELGDWLKKKSLFKIVLLIFQQAEANRQDPLLWNTMVEKVCQQEFAFNAYPNGADRQLLLASFIALVGHAREKRSGKDFPLVPSQVQLWVRELRRLGRVVSPVPIFSWLDEPVETVKSLPAFHCSECGESGWVGMHLPKEDTPIQQTGVLGIQLDDEPANVYRGWFGHNGQKSQYITIISPWSESDSLAEEKKPKQQGLEDNRDFFCPISLILRKGDGPCPLTGSTQRFRVKVDRAIRVTAQGDVIGDQGCPRCGSKNGVFFIGSQAATLSSVAIDEMFGSVLNNDPKLLAFTDSVQDASHRAGFFTARTYHFTYRTALQHVIDEAGDAGLPLPETGSRLIAYWSQIKPGFPGPGKAIEALLPPDLQQYPLYLDFRGSTSTSPPAKLLKEVECRLCWQATSEFGLMQTHGRSLEFSGSSCLGWDEGRIDKTLACLRERLPGIDPLLDGVPDRNFRLWIYGLLHRYRERGSINHPYLDSLARQNYWGKYPFGRAVDGREAYPPAGRFRPRLLVTERQSGHEYILAPTSSSMAPWPIVWSYRALEEPTVPESSILDLLKAFLSAGVETGLLKKLHKDGMKEYLVIAADAARLYAKGVYLACDASEQKIFRPAHEAVLWQDGPSMDYFSSAGRYRRESFSQRQLYYQARYRKGALRRVVAHEHTGLLATEERESLERNFAEMKHADDPNILTCTSTLEMGIDIGDLSSTLLCSVPPNTASYLQRIGRAGRSTGTALIVAFINQQPHDLFFFARPSEMLKGKVEPPGCWLDASAVLVRQYLGFCFDSATHMQILPELPKTGKQLVDDMASTHGLIPAMMAWVAKSETELRNSFLRRFSGTVVQDDTRERFFLETETEILLQRIYKAVNEFDRLRKDLENAKKRLNNQLKDLGAEELEAKREIEDELRIIKGRSNSLSRTGALEIFTDHGLLPNYAFPERGVRFYGAIYNKHQDKKQNHKPIELTRPAGAALRELAPNNVFYTHSRQFTIQQIAIGNAQQPIIESWGICGRCGHMRMVDDLNKPGASPSCPQCGHGAEDQESQLDQGQQKKFLEFSQSQALSFMEHYESLSGDKNEERQREFYQILTCFDHTIEAPVGAVGNDDLPFGIEYRASMIRRDVNVGYFGNGGGVPFGPDQEAPEYGFKVCADCGIVVPPDMKKDHIIKDKMVSQHRRSCHGRRKYDKMRQEGRLGDPFKWESIYLYRQLRSEAIRLLLPLIDSEDINTLIACIYLGLRLRFEGNPAHLTIAPQVLPEPATGLEKHYLIMMDAVPGGTGYLKTLFQEKDAVSGLEGEGIMKVLRLACDALETCQCRKLPLQYGVDDTDGCYRCLRSYHLQYKADQISRDRGIVLLKALIEAGDKRVRQMNLEAIKPDSLFGSVLEKKVIDCLQAFVVAEKGKWETTIIRGGKGFRFSLPDSERIWEIELQPSLGLAQEVANASQPDFLLSCDDDDIKPVAIFADGFEYHCFPHNRLADDMRKRRAIIDTGKYHVWNVTWEDLMTDKPEHVMVCHQPVASTLLEYASKAKGIVVPDARLVVRNGIEQLKAFIRKPVASGWKVVADFAVFWPLGLLYDKRKVVFPQLIPALDVWRSGAGMPSVLHVEEGDWVYNDKVSLNQDILAYIAAEDVLGNRRSAFVNLARLGDSETEVSGSDFKERWRRFLACVNLYQFNSNFRFWTSSEMESGCAPDIPVAEAELPVTWQEIMNETASVLRPYISVLATAEIAIPEVEYFNDNIDDDAFAELAWPKCNPPVAVLAGDQTDFAGTWQKLGWKVVVFEDLQVKGGNWLADIVKKNAKGE